jgi:hypothetical protein
MLTFINQYMLEKQILNDASKDSSRDRQFFKSEVDRNHVKNVYKAI